MPLPIPNVTAVLVRPFFAAVAELDLDQGVCVYLTDGYGDFPDDEPALPMLWVVTPGGLDDDRFPFGKVVRMES